MRLLHGQAEDCDDGTAHTIVFGLGKETVKQYMAAANLMQLLQQTMLFGMRKDAKITADDMIKQDFKVRKRPENAMRLNSLVDAAQGRFLISCFYTSQLQCMHYLSHLCMPCALIHNLTALARPLCALSICT